MHHAGFIDYNIRFEPDSAKLSIKTMTDTLDYQLKLPELLSPEGPGTSVFLGSLTLSKGYRINSDGLVQPLKSGKLNGPN